MQSIKEIYDILTSFDVTPCTSTIKSLSQPNYIYLSIQPYLKVSNKFYFYISRLVYKKGINRISIQRNGKIIIQFDAKEWEIYHPCSTTLYTCKITKELENEGLSILKIDKSKRKSRMINYKEKKGKEKYSKFFYFFYNNENLPEGVVTKLKEIEKMQGVSKLKVKENKISMKLDNKYWN